MAGLDDAGMDGADGDLVDAVAFDLHEGIGVQARVEVAAPVSVAAQGVTVAGQASWSSQGRGSAGRCCGDAEQVADGALHAGGGGEGVGEAGVGGLTDRVDRGGEDERRRRAAGRRRGWKSTCRRRVAIVGAPQSAEGGAEAFQSRWRAATALRSGSRWAQAMFAGRGCGAGRRNRERHRGHPISLAAARYQLARAGGM